MLIFWAIVAVMTLAVGAILAAAVVRGGGRTPAARAASDVAVYRAQLEEVDRDVARGVIDTADAERVHAEIARRLIAADRAEATEAAPAARAPSAVALGLIAVGLVGSVSTYLWLGAPGYGDMALKDRIAFAEEVRRTRPDQSVAEASLPAFEQPDDLGAEYARLLDQLRATVAARPDDLQGQILLAQQEQRIGNFIAAKEAQARVVTLKGDQVSADDLADLGELQVMAAGGYVSPEAEMSLRAALAQAPQHPVAQYYYGLMLAQTGRPDQAFRLWDRLLRQGPEGAPWIAPILAQIEELAQLAGVRYSVPAIGSAAPGPSADDLEAAKEMTPAERMEMIGAMVQGLSDRLATDGGSAQDWARLISSLGVLGRQSEAAAIHANAIEVFAGEEAALDLINAAGQRAGVID